MNIIPNKYQGTNQQGSIFTDQAHIHNYIQIIFTTNHKQDSTHGDNIQKIYIFSDDGGVGCCYWFACELQFGTGYPELGVPVPIVIVCLISCLKFTSKTIILAMSQLFRQRGSEIS